MIKKPTSLDAILLCLFVALITWQPFYLHHEIIMMETGIHLLAIGALFDGGVPYRDFHFLRGPLELYVPALMMKIWGENSVCLPTFYYVGTIALFLLSVWIARYLFRSRLVMWMMILVLVARTFPRVSFYYWGGMRYAIGFAALLLGILFFKRQRVHWIVLAGVVSGMAFLTTIEAGISIVSAFVAALCFAYVFEIQPRPLVIKAFMGYVTGFLLVLIPYCIYLWMTDSLQPFVEAMYVVVRFNHMAFPGEYGVKPETIGDWLFAFNPVSRYFKFMTPVFCYLAFGVYLVRRIRLKKLDGTHAFLVGVAVYGLVLYMAAFRKIEGHHFEMALQPEKCILFYLFEEALLFLTTLIPQLKSRLATLPIKGKAQLIDKTKLTLIYAVFIGFIGGSVGYAIQRYDHRFPAFKWVKKNVFHLNVKGLSLLEGQETETLRLKRLDGITVPRWQAEEIKGIVEFLEVNTRPDEVIFGYPEVGNFSFWAGRPFMGRFPIATFTWMYAPWHEELLNDFKRLKPRYVIMTHLGHRTFPSVWYFRNPKNRERFYLFTNLILENYEIVKSFEAVSIYQLK